MRFISPSTILHLLAFLTPCTSYTQVPSALDELQIRNKLALYAYAIDFKKFDDLDEVFTTDAYAIYGATERDRLRGVPAIKAWISNAVTSQISQHAVTSILIETVPTTPPHLTANHNSKNIGGINSTSSFIATYAGRNETGSVVTYYGTYIDSWIRGKELQQRVWKIRGRTTTIRLSDGA